jgi:hypothetical protein
VTVGDATDALALVRLHDLVTAGRGLVERLARELEDYAPGAICAGGEVEASVDRQRRIVGEVEELLDVAELAHMIREALVQREFRVLDVEAAAVELAAADWLRSGIADARQLRLAARLLPAREGLVALADALESVGEPWISEAMLRDLLGAFRQFPAQLVDRIAEEADIDVDARLDEIDPGAVQALIRALRHAALGLPSGEGGS